MCCARKRLRSGVVDHLGSYRSGTECCQHTHACRSRIRWKLRMPAGDGIAVIDYHLFNLFQYISIYIWFYIYISHHFPQNGWHDVTDVYRKSTTHGMAQRHESKAAGSMSASAPSLRLPSPSKLWHHLQVPRSSSVSGPPETNNDNLPQPKHEMNNNP